MIIDKIDNIHRYLALAKGFPKAIEFLSRTDWNQLPADKYEIDNDRVYAMLAKEPGRKKGGALLEIHENYIDIQLVLAGTDEMGWKPASSCEHPAGEYDIESDIQFFEDDPDFWIPVKQGFFVIFFPEDAHLPMISAGQIHKVVVKVAVD
jgi:biofilm protein TabA